MKNAKAALNLGETKPTSNTAKISTTANIISSISVLIAAVSVIIGMYPQIIWGNDNYAAKATAGDVYSQLFLAQHYYEIGEYTDAIYWYKTASVAKNDDYRAIACNNLGYLYAQGYGLSDYENEGYHRYETAWKLFCKATEAGCEISEPNALALLKSNSPDCFPNINYDHELATLSYDADSLVVPCGYEYRQISKGAVFWEGNKKYTGGACVTHLGENGYTRSEYVYFVQTYADDTEIPNYEFAYLE